MNEDIINITSSKTSTKYILKINDLEGKLVLGWQIEPEQKIVLNGKEVTEIELLEKLKTLK